MVPSNSFLSDTLPAKGPRDRSNYKHDSNASEKDDITAVEDLPRNSTGCQAPAISYQVTPAVQRWDS